MHIQSNCVFSLMYHVYLNLKIKTTYITRSFVIWHTVEHSSCILQHYSLVKCLGNKEFCDRIILRNTIYLYCFFFRDLQFMLEIKNKGKVYSKNKRKQNSVFI